MVTRILIVDDSEHFQRSARELLTMRGFEVLGTVADGEEALAFAGRSRPDGVLLDVNLPGRDGFAVAASLASAHAGIRIVLTSSEADEPSTSQLEACGAVAFIPKTELACSDLGMHFAG